MTDAGTPASDGGHPAKTVPYGRAPRYGEEELQELREALEQGTLFYAQGKKVYALEAAFAAYVGARHAVTTTSGTASIHAALIALGVAPGDEVITSPITDMGSVIPILFQGAAPVFADLDPRTYTMDPAAVEAAITPRTAAVVAVHLAGNACNLDALQAVCARHGVALIEDCAQAFGCRYGERFAGTIGRVGCFSFNEFKHISCGDGGIVVTDDDELAARLRLATDKCYDRRPDAAIRNPSFLANNYRMTELQAAVALAQLRKLEGILARRRSWCGRLMAATADLPGLLPPTITPQCTPSWWFYMMRAAEGANAHRTDQLAGALRAEGLPVGAHYIGQPVYEYPIFTSGSAFSRGEHAYQTLAYGRGLCPEAERILETCLILSVNEAYTDQDLEETIAGMHRAAAWAMAQDTPGDGA